MSSADLQKIAYECKNLPNDHLAIWLHELENGNVKYEVFTGPNVVFDAEREKIIDAWLLALDPYIPDMPFNPFYAVLNGVSEMAKQHLTFPKKYWDCEDSDYTQLPWVSDAADCVDECITTEDWAFLCGVWDGVINEASGIVDFFAILSDGQKRSELKQSLLSLKNSETWAAMWQNLKTQHTEATSCQLSHLIGKDVVAVGSLLLPITKLSRAKMIATAGNLADNVVLTLARFKNVASGAYRVATGTITVVKEGSGFLINRIGGTVLWALGEGIDLFGDGTSLKLAFSNGYEAIGPNGIKIQGEVLMEDANQALVKMKQAGSEVLAVISRDLTPILLNSGDEFNVLTNARKLPGTVTGNGINVSGKWLRGTEGNAGLFPKSVADKLRGRTFNNFDEFRQAFWKEVANDPNLTKQFSPKDIAIMKNGFAPEVLESQRIGGNIKYVLHHKTPINRGGAVYDVDNLYIVTPKYHKEILNPAYHYGYGY